MRRSFLIALVATMGLLPGCGSDSGGSSAPSPARTPTAAHRITVTSTAFTEGGTIPRRHTCDGEDVSPPLAFSGVPTDTTGLVLMMEDPDAPHGTFTHWLVWNIGPRTTELAADQAPRGATQGRNGFGRTGYGGPCPPRGDSPHHYVVTVYAADRRLDLAPDATPDDVRRALTDHTLATGTLTGRYGR
ncbi:YbhB/YbcL family Raf kinase inhibitor-like protein [Streptomyces sp. NPDC050625]|uniref:YbhB/YbcL family Raf kinase inhibitor-like protein n=1 Tax=Streptomyces sp. NPDC050625 TaxID=3154629 RepID=UPI00342A7C27